MRFLSTRGQSQPAGLQQALESGLAPDGGLYVPEVLPQFSPNDFAGCASPAAVAHRLLTPFFEQAPIAAELDEIARATFAFPLPLEPLGRQDQAQVLELYHGPTAAFKDVGARFLAACLQKLPHEDVGPRTILVATSGDTGGAVAAAFHGKRGFRVLVLFPHGRVSHRQLKQLACWGGNVRAVAVAGSFDDCQGLVKEAFAQSVTEPAWRLGSANSINIGRLLPQCAYYAYASLQTWRASGEAAGFVVPTGNLGNALACIMARAMGLPIGPVILATNANRTIGDYLEKGSYEPRPALATLATAMDVGDPSNMERLRNLLGEADVLRDRLGVLSVDDEQIKAEIRRDFEEFGFATCPHTATATHAWRQMDGALRTAHDWILVATAHPAKFETIVEPLIGETVPLPEELAEILARPSRSIAIAPELAALATAMDKFFG